MWTATGRPTWTRPVSTISDGLWAATTARCSSASTRACEREFSPWRAGPSPRTAAVPAKAVIYQMAKGDQSVPNPNGTAILRAGDLADRATFYRHDLPPRFGLRGDPDTAEESMKCTQPTCAPAISGGS